VGGSSTQEQISCVTSPSPAAGGHTPLNVGDSNVVCYKDRVRILGGKK
jgi:hypothetical protein